MPHVLYDNSTFSLRSGESVLDALVRGGANIPFSCRKGSCQICLMQVVEGEVGAAGTQGLRPDMIDAGMFLPCCAHPEGDLEICAPDLEQLFVPLQLVRTERLSTSVVLLAFEPRSRMDWRPGQFINLRRSDGLVRSYSIASLPEDGQLEIHVKRIEDGQMSEWLWDEIRLGETVGAQGPVGTCTYDPQDRDRSLLLLATGSGLSPVYGICRDALRRGHQGRIVLYHGSRTRDGLYLRTELDELARIHPNLEIHACLTQEPELPKGVLRGRITEHAFEDLPDLEGWKVYLCGIPEMVYEGRHRAVLAGVRRDDLRADPFEYAQPYMPDDPAKLRTVAPDPELWQAMGEGEGLTQILTAFYTEVYEDPRLSPFFRSITMARAIQQQWAFLTDVFTGRDAYFGLRPFNAHHWMVITDELFDYREALFEKHLRARGLAEPLVRRWSAFHEMWRREIVKGSPRGLVVDDVEKPVERPEMVTLDLDMVCSGCHAEVLAGTPVHYEPQDGEIFCPDCVAKPAPT